MLTMTDDRSAIQIEGYAAHVPPFQLRAAHAGSNAFDNQVAFEFGDGPDDDNDGAAQRAAGVDVLAETYELDTEVIEVIKDFEEVAYAARHAIEGPNQHHIEAMAAGVLQKFIEAGAARLRTADSIGVFVDDFETALLRHGPKIEKLGLRMLIQCGNAHVEGRAFQANRPPA